MKKILKWVGGGFFALVVLGVVVNAMKAEKAAQQAAPESDQAAKTPAQVAALPSVTAHDMAVAYDENTVAADQQFKDKAFKVTGTVAEINTDILGRPYLTLRGGVNEFMEPQFAFDKDAGPQLAKLKRGAQVEMTCTGRGDMAKIPMSDSCSLI
ncbi:OB-fold protein [Rugamonas aquatica]|nr:hypothetical protein [Rugamonas aquatica]